MLTPLGKFLRMLRIDRDELLKDMADKLEIASSSLSSIECGRRKPPKNFRSKIANLYALKDSQLLELDDAILRSKDTLSLKINNLSNQDKDLAIAFSRRFEKLNKEEKERIRRILNENTQ